jgi:hypothetical protein
MKHEAINNRIKGRLLAFDQYIGIDYSGAKTPVSSIKGLRVYLADRVFSPFSNKGRSF